MRQLSTLSAKAQYVLFALQFIVTMTAVTLFTTFLFHDEVSRATIQARQNAAQLSVLQVQLDQVLRKQTYMDGYLSVFTYNYDDDARRYFRERNDPKNK